MTRQKRMYSKREDHSSGGLLAYHIVGVNIVAFFIYYNWSFTIELRKVNGLVCHH